MANLNLSEFGEKTFVADADHTFIWDTAASISKRVSRNSWLSGTTADFHLWLADAATAVAQTISVQSVVAGTTNTAGANLSINGSQGTGTGAGGSLLLRTAPAGSSGTAQNALVTAVAITSAGNVGIGTTAPSTKLEVALPASGNTFNQGIKLSRGTGYITLGNGTISNDNFVGQFSGKGSNTASAVALGFLGVAANDSDTTSPVVYFTTRNNAETGPIGNSQVAYQFRNYTDNLVTVLGSGNVGIGTTSPTSKLHVAGELGSNTTTYDTAAGIRLTNTTSNNSWIISSGVIGASNSRFCIRETGAADPSLIISGTNIGLGTVSPTARLHVAGTIKPEQATMVDKAAGFTLAAVDAGTVINSTSATAITINLPAADTAAGYNVMIIQSGAGAVTIAANGNTLNSFGNALITAGQHAACSIVRTAASTYNLSGNLV